MRAMTATLSASELLLHDPQAALERLGLRFPAALQVDPRDPLAQDLPEWPAFLKVVEPFVPHKTEMGAVRPGTAHDIPAFAREVGERLGQPVTKVRLEERVSVPEGGEALLAVIHDDAFGPVICFGEGGRLTELRRNVQRWLPGETPERIAELLQRLPLAKAWFQGYRNAPPLVDLPKLARLLADVGGLVTEFHRAHPDRILRDLEVNPLALTTEGPVALDLLVTLHDRVPRAEAPRPDLAKLAGAMRDCRSVAVVGPSTTDPTSLGRVLYERLLHEFEGPAWAINPKGGEIAGRPVFETLAQLPEAPDMLVLALPARATAPTLREAYALFGQRLGAVLMLASGFDETEKGGDLGADLRQAVREVAPIPVLGPNTMAVYSQSGSPRDVRVDFLPEGRLEVPSFPDRSTNNLAMVLQSGARFCSFLDRQPAVGLRWALMVGNAYGVDIADGVELAAQDPGVQCVAVYLEGLAEDAGRRLAGAVRHCRQQGKVVVIQKGGRTSQGAAAARSHTASMSGSHDVFEAALAGAGAVLADSEADFLEVARLGSLLPVPPEGRRVFVLNGAGYEGVLAADEAGRRDLQLTKPPAEVTRVLEPWLGRVLDATNNPADVGPATPDAAYAEALDAALPHYDLAVVAVMPHGNGMAGTLPPYDRPDGLGPLLVEVIRRNRKPVVVSVNGGTRWEGFRRFLEGEGIPVLPDSERAMRALGLWVDGVSR